MSLGLSAPVLGIYCERGTDPSFWAEPVNAVTNAAFLIAGAAILARSRGDRAVALLGWMTIVIGIGSFLFHTLATRAAMLADVGPIQVFIAVYFFLAMRRFFGLGVLASLLATVAFVAAAAAMPAFFPHREPWLGFSGYFGGLVGLVSVAVGLVAGGGPMRGTGLTLLGIAGLFCVALTFRSVDGAVCRMIATGTHPLWHVVNSVVLYALAAALRRAPRI